MYQLHDIKARVVRLQELTNGLAKEAADSFWLRKGRPKRRMIQLWINLK